MKTNILIIFSFLFLACGKDQKTIENEVDLSANDRLFTITKAQFESEKMEFGKISKQVFNSKIKTTGIIDVPPENRASINTFIDGYITKIQLLIGDKVSKGQVVATIQNTKIVEIQQDYLETAAQLSYLKNEYGRQKKLFKERITSEKNYLKSESNYKSNLAIYNGLRKKLQMINIDPNKVEKGIIVSTINLYSPIDGYVTQVNVSNGSYVSSEKEILEIVNTDHIHLELTVFEKDILAIQKNQKIRFKIPEASGNFYDAEVHLVGTFVDMDRTIKIHGHINDDEKTNFISGMFIEAEIITAENTKDAIPKSAVIKEGNNYYLIALKEQKKDTYIFEKKLVNIGFENENFIEIKDFEQLKGNKIVSKGISMF